VLHNLQERDRIIDASNDLMNRLFAHLCTTGDSKEFFSRSLQGIHNRVSTLHDAYQQTIVRFNLGIISFISDYYSIIDQHSDQFQYPHTYSDHRGHYAPILTEDINPLFDINDLVGIFAEHCYEFKRFKFHNGSTHPRRARDRTWAIYQSLSNYIASESVYDQSDTLIHEFDAIVSGLTKFVSTDPILSGSLRKPKLSKHTIDDAGLKLINQLRHMNQKFNNIKLDFRPSEEIPDYCECGSVMQIMAASSEMVCNQCGYLYELKGTVFSDAQFYAQDSTRYRTAGYEPSKHCKSWLERIQARETNTITEAQLSKIENCIRRDGIANKKRLSIEQLRRYLKDTGLTELNEHVALIKRLITGVAPPQLSYAETQDITNSFSKAVKAYNLIRPVDKSNLIFYPYLLWKLIEMHVSDYSKRKTLLSFIHLQGTQTLIQNDQIWARICSATPGFVYHPTDRYKYLD
jgi:hypothetical protein